MGKLLPIHAEDHGDLEREETEEMDDPENRAAKIKNILDAYKDACVHHPDAASHSALGEDEAMRERRFEDEIPPSSFLSMRF